MPKTGEKIARLLTRRLAPKIILALLFIASATEVALASPPVVFNTGLTPAECYRRDSQCTQFCADVSRTRRYECFSICDRMLDNCLQSGDWSDSRIDPTPDDDGDGPPTKPLFTPVVDLSVMRLMFALADDDGDGAVSLKEFGAANAKVFKHIDADHDGKATRAEIELFFSDAPMRE
jgi:hypothetical protein